MFKIFVHFPCADSFMDEDICLPIEMPFVPRIGEHLYIPQKDYAHLEEKINKSEKLRVKYKRWLYPDFKPGKGKRCSFDDSGVVIDLLWRHRTKEIHIELGADIHEKDDYANKYY